MRKTHKAVKGDFSNGVVCQQVGKHIESNNNYNKVTCKKCLMMGVAGEMLG